MVKMPLLIKHMSNSLNVNSNNATSANAAVTEKPPAFGLRHKDRYKLIRNNFDKN